MVIFDVSDRHGAVCLSVSCAIVLWCLALSSFLPSSLQFPRLLMSFCFVLLVFGLLLLFFFQLFRLVFSPSLFLHPCCSRSCPALPLRLLHAAP